VKRIAFLGAFVAAFGLVAEAAPPVGSISSSSAFELDGSLVTVEGVPFWPLMAGSNVVSRSSPVYITLRDGSRISLSANSRIRLSSSGQTVSADLVAGSMQFVLAAGSDVKVSRGATPVDGTSGSVSAAGVSNSDSVRVPAKALVPQLGGLSKYK
jgi:hypothetical protein